MSSVTLGQLTAIAVGDPAAPIAVVVLHGREMCGADLAPFASTLANDAYWLFPDAPIVAGTHTLSLTRSSGSGTPLAASRLTAIAATSSGPGHARSRTWWPIDSEARIRGLEAGPLELSQMDPPGRAEARAALDSFVTCLPAQRIVYVGFSQGGMLAVDYILHGGRRPAALALASSTRIAIGDWQPRAAVLRGLPVLVAHGRADAELAFAAGEQLRDFAIAGGAEVTWLPFDGGHEMPFVVWRALKKLVRGLVEQV